MWPSRRSTKTGVVLGDVIDQLVGWEHGGRPPLVVPLAVDDPRAFGLRAGKCGDASAEFVLGGCGAELHSGKTQATVDKVNMCVVEAGEHAAPLKVDDARSGAGEAKDVSRGPNLKDAIAVDGDGFGFWLSRVLGPDMTVYQHQAGKGLGLSGGGAGDNKGHAKKEVPVHAAAP